MKVFKFGGASIRDAAAIRNMAEIVSRHAGEPLIVVVSAMGKTTNAFEEVLRRAGNQASQDEQLNLIRDYHMEIVSELFDGHPVGGQINEIMDEARLQARRQRDYNEWYDQVISAGELLSSTLIHAWLVHQGISAIWMDARKSILTDDHFREGKIIWEATHAALHDQFVPALENGVVITQGFIGGTSGKRTTTLGREGSDYSAAIIASCLKAGSVTVWKDVDGIMNADPKRIKDTVKLNELPYREAAEMTYYGASVIHPKTIKPLANDHIPLYVRSFFHPDAAGTIICDSDSFVPVPVLILKDDQCLVSFSVRDFTFVNERNLSMIFHQLAEADMKINMMQNSAITFSVCVDYDEKKLDFLMERLKGLFSIRFNTGLLLVTIKHYSAEYVNEYRAASRILLEQMTRTTFQVLIEP